MIYLQKRLRKGIPPTIDLHHRGIYDFLLKSIYSHKPIAVDVNIVKTALIFVYLNL